VLPLEVMLGADSDVADDGTIAVGVPAPGSVAVFGVPVLWGVPALVLIVTDGATATDEHVAS
jgi:hypothetical protein